MNAHRGKAILAAAAWKDLNAKSANYMAAVMRGDHDVAKALRQEAHDILDTHLDLSGEIARAAVDSLPE